VTLFNGYSIQRATAPEVDVTARVIGTAFAELEASAWLVPDAGRRADVLTGVFRIIVAHAVRGFGKVHLLRDGARGVRAGHDGEPVSGAAEGIRAVAVWFYRDRPQRPPAGYEGRLEIAAGEHVHRFHHLNALFDAHRPQGPHHHLVALVVAAECRRLGRGSALLAYYHRQLELSGVPAYLEAAGMANRAFYLRNGYQQAGHSFVLPSRATFYPMWRPPLPTPDSAPPARWR
jgi:GNAT superfamily N-acetyltransferase